MGSLNKVLSEFVFLNLEEGEYFSKVCFLLLDERWRRKFYLYNLKVVLNILKENDIRD